MLSNSFDMDALERRVAAIEAAIEKMKATWSVKRISGLWTYVRAVRLMTLRHGHL